jgi:purine-binding chemotaxis protein CheW
MSDREIRLITFTVGPEKFVFDIMAVRQIIPYGGSTLIPKLPAFIEGVIVLRNEVIPIIDLRTRLFPQLAKPEAEQLVLVTETSEGTLGLKVDSVLRIINVGAEAILPPPPLIRGMQGDLFIGVIQQEKEVFLLLDIQTLLSAEERSSLRTADFSAAHAAADSQAQPASK